MNAHLHPDERHLRPIRHLAPQLGLDEQVLIPYGHHMAKLPLDLIDPARAAQSKVILVTAISPTPAGEGKTTTSVGLSMAMNRLGHSTVAALREPSLGPVFGMKGGATGGGKAQVAPRAAINLHFTGDFNAIEKAHNLLAALADNHLYRRQSPALDARRMLWPRVMDMNDRALRATLTGLNGQGAPRETSFDITAASEVMAILCLATSRADLKARLGRLLVGAGPDGSPVTAADLGAVGGMAALLADALQPNLVQTLEGTPAILHGGPFANIAHGCNSVLATELARTLGDYVVTEAGFGADLGAEKFLHIKARQQGWAPHAVVLVATLRALRFHGGVSVKEVAEPNPTATQAGLANLRRHLANLKAWGLRPVVALNAFPTDTAEETKLVRELAEAEGAGFAVSRVFADGGPGGEELAKVVVQAAQGPMPALQPTYALDDEPEAKLAALATQVYGADGVDLSPEAKRDLRQWAERGAATWPLCMAKTQYSFSDDPGRLGAPSGFRLQVRRVVGAPGAGFLVPLTGEIMRMPGLPKRPAALDLDVDDHGQIHGLA